jgi:hypothetical protein
MLALGGCALGNVSQYEGNYEGSYSGSDFGDLTLHVAANGDISVDATSKIFTTTYHGTGSINHDGHGSASTGTGAGGFVSFSFAGDFNYGPPAKGSGPWTSSNGGSGSWSATRQQ